MSCVASNAAEKASPPLSREPLQGESWTAVLGAIQQAAKVNRLELDADTHSDGDCGPDAVLRNLERLQPTGTASTQVLTSLARQGRKSAIQAIRRLLVQWLRSPAGSAVVPDMSVRQWIEFEMETQYASFESYLAAMTRAGTWIDTAMMYAASAVFGVQIVMLIGRDEPQLIAAAPILGRNGVPVALIANLANIHFFALKPRQQLDAIVHPDIASTVPEDIDGDMLLTCCQSAPDEDDAELQPDPEETPIRRTEQAHQTDEGKAEPLALAPAAEDNMFTICSEISRWDPFSSQPTSLPSLLRSLGASAGQRCNSSCVHSALQLRDGLKMLQWESSDEAVGVNREYQHCIARRHYAQAGVAYREKNFERSQRLQKVLSLNRVVANLNEKCWKNEKEHRCLDDFRKAPQAVLRWRTLWYSLPKPDRDERLRRMFSAALENHRRTGLPDEDFHMKYTILGQEVCRQAFLLITGRSTYKTYPH